MKDLTCFHLITEENAFCSNWFPAEFTDGTHTFNSVEQYMMWQKAMTFEDKETAAKILKSNDPAKIKRLGREVRNYNDSVWSAKRFNVVKDGVRMKFTQNEVLKNRLLACKGEFAECAKNDLVWGIGLGMRDPNRFDKKKWRGQNLLGVALENVRDELS